MAGAVASPQPYEFKLANLAAPIGWAFNERWDRFVTWTWRERCANATCGKAPERNLADSGTRAIAAAVALTFWPELFDKQVDAA